MNVPEDCKHRNSFKKDCCKVICDCTIVEHDGCVTNEGCDLVAYDNERFFLIEIKGGVINKSDAKDIVEQIKSCKDYYRSLVGERRVIHLFLRCVKEGKSRLEKYAREPLIRNRIRIEKCHGSFDLRNLD